MEVNDQANGIAHTAKENVSSFLLFLHASDERPNGDVGLGGIA